MVGARRHTLATEVFWPSMQNASSGGLYIFLLFVIAFLYFAFAIGAVVMLFLRPRLRRRIR